MALAAAFYRLRAIRGSQDCKQGWESGGSPGSPEGFWRKSGRSQVGVRGVRWETGESGGSPAGVQGSPEGIYILN